jgi:FkbM family methyltransferase
MALILDTLRQLRNLGQRGLRRLPIENAVAALHHQAPPEVQKWTRKIIPGPSLYRPHEVIETQREGLTWHLHPAEYFQWHQAFGLFDEVSFLLTQLNHDARTFVDVGANIGFYSLSMAKRFEGHLSVLAVEPNPPTRQWLERHRALNGLDDVVVDSRALSESPGTAVLRGGTRGDSGHFSLRDSQTGSSGDVEVEMTTLDRLHKEKKLSGLDVLKIDVEGFEPAVLLGGKTVLKKYLPSICLEFFPLWYQSALPSARKAFSMLQALGYTAYKLCGEERGASVLRPFDAVGAVDDKKALNEMTNIVLLHPERRAACERLSRFVEG